MLAINLLYILQMSSLYYQARAYAVAYTTQASTCRMEGTMKFVLKHDRKLVV